MASYIFKVIMPFMALLSLMGVTGAIPTSLEASDVTNNGINGSASSGLHARSYQNSAPYADPHTQDPLLLVGSDELCKDRTYEDGDYYCSRIDQVIYTNVAHDGEYREVVYMNDETGECRFADVNRTFSGELAPFNEPVALTFRGPIHLKQLGIYTPSGPGYSRIGYYNAAQQTAQGISFLGNRGGEGSGVVGKSFGASLSYVNAHASGGTASPQVLANEVVTGEFVVMTDQDCDGSSSCGYVPSRFRG
ncbi:target of Sbf [Neurospora sp. IMI 360204]|nr:target of Sbf [Neurospora sp. IMI 360204]